MRKPAITAIVLAVFGSASASADAPVDYEREIRPIFDKHCYSCHGAEKQTSGLRVDALRFLRQGGDRGPALTPGAPADSLLMDAIAGDGTEIPPMPPKGERLTSSEISLIREWVKQGAPGPREASSIAATRAPKSDHWAFQPISRPSLPTVRDVSWTRTPIDRFILTRLERDGVRPSPETDRATLLRRATLDLTGLPPTVDETQAFLADIRPDAYERCVSRLLASPAYGERWGRHWLDAACYADSGGYESDFPRSLWRYRDWVIDALNHDLPFDQFASQQLAGDLMPSDSLEPLIATGFLCTAMYDGTLGQGENARLKMTVDRVNMIGTVFLGLTLGCAQCHSHKFDPISQREYYQFFAFLNNIDDGRQELELAPPEEIARRDALRIRLEALERELRAYEHAATWEEGLADAVATPLSDAAGEAERTRRRTAFLDRDFGHGLRVKTIAALRDQDPKIRKTHVARELAAPRTTHIFRRGEFSEPAGAVKPNVPTVLPRMTGGDHASRLDLARWLVVPSNPLTARVIVNRVWQQYFGLGIVATEDNFGLSGEPPSHPELLDWLAHDFVTQGWSLKRLHRLIVESAVYRQSSHVRPELAEVDPQNRLLARQSRMRLEAESIRDAALAVSGLLSRKVGGPSVFPYQPEGVLTGRAVKADWVVSPGEDRHRRGMYTYFWRLTPHPFLRLFDAPDSSSACTRRTRSNTPVQALTLLNDPMFIECAEALANRLLKDIPAGDRERIRHAFRLCLGREATTSELQKIERYLADWRAPGATSERDRSAWVGLARAMLNLDEFMTKE